MKFIDIATIIAVAIIGATTIYLVFIVESPLDRATRTATAPTSDQEPSRFTKPANDIAKGVHLLLEDYQQEVRSPAGFITYEPAKRPFIVRDGIKKRIDLGDQIPDLQDSGFSPDHRYLYFYQGQFLEGAAVTLYIYDVDNETLHQTGLEVDTLDYIASTDWLSNIVLEVQKIATQPPPTTYRSSSTGKPWEIIPVDPQTADSTDHIPRLVFEPYSGDAQLEPGQWTNRPILQPVLVIGGESNTIDFGEEIPDVSEFGFGFSSDYRYLYLFQGNFSEEPGLKFYIYDLLQKELHDTGLIARSRDRYGTPQWISDHQLQVLVKADGLEDQYPDPFQISDTLYKTPPSAKPWEMIPVYDE